MNTTKTKTMVKPCVKCGAQDRNKRGQCKPCRKAMAAAWYLANKERAKSKATSAAWRKNNPEKAKAKDAAYRKANLYRRNTHEAKRRAAKLNAVPTWGNNWLDKIKIQELFLIAKIRSKVEGIQYQVDHAVPLQSDLVCGLHCFNNLQILPASENISKGNRTWPDMP